MTERWTARWFRPRALLYHLLVGILAPGCLWAGWWQITRAEGGNTLSYLYAFEWPIFALLAVVGWWQLIHEDPAAVESRKIERARRAANRGPFVPPPPDTESGFTPVLGEARRAALGAPGADGRDLARSGPGDAVAASSIPPDEAVGVHALSSYNAYLARLSAGGARKSWRNPHGLAAGTTRAEPAPALVATRRPVPAAGARLPAEVGPAQDRPRPAGEPHQEEG